MTASKPSSSKPSSAPPGRKAPERRGLRSLAATLPPITAPIFKTRGFAEAGILTDWPAIVGDMLGRRTAPERIAFPRGAKRDGTLHITCESAFAPELLHLAPQVIERINGYFGYPAVAQLKILHGRVATGTRAPRQPAAARAGLAEHAAPYKGAADGAPPIQAPSIEDPSIEDEALRAALARLGAAIEAKGKSRNGG